MVQVLCTMVAQGCVMAQLKHTMVYYTLLWFKLLYHDTVIPYHGTPAVYRGTPWLHHGCTMVHFHKGN